MLPANTCVCTFQDIPEGAELVRVPLRLAITDVMDDEQRSQLVKQVSVRPDPAALTSRLHSPLPASCTDHYTSRLVYASCCLSMSHYLLIAYGKL